MLDFRKISLSSQMARVESGEIELADFDFHYAKYHLGRAGFLALEEMKVQAAGDPELLALIENPLPLGAALRVRNAPGLWDNVTFRPEPFDIDERLRTAINRHVRFVEMQQTVLIRADADEDGEYEVVMIGLMDERIVAAAFFYRDGLQWQQGNVNWNFNTQPVYEEIVNGAITLKPRRYKQLDVGGTTFRLSTRPEPALRAIP